MEGTSPVEPDTSRTSAAAEEQRKPKGRSDQDLNSAIAGTISELLFVILPLLVLAIAFQYKGAIWTLWSSPEWSFAAAILFGQGLAKIVASISKIGTPFGERVEFLCAFLLVVGLVPALIILALILISEPPALWLTIAQLCLFVLSVATFFCVRVVSLSFR